MKPKHLYPKPGGLDPDDMADVPRHVTPSLYAATWQEMRTARSASQDDFARWRLAVGQGRAPQFLAEAWQRNKISRRTLQRHIGSIWHTSDIPDYWLTHDQWRELFAAAGYTRVAYTPPGAAGMTLGSTERGRAAARTERPITIYRGSIPERRDDWSWTANPDIAARWASGQHYTRPAGQVWTTTARPEHLLCRIDRWDQYVVDTSGLTIHQHHQETA